MEVIRKVGNYQMNVGDGAAKGLYNVSDNKGGVSCWFDSDTMNDLMNMNKTDFVSFAKEEIEDVDDFKQRLKELNDDSEE